jgi:hypothetical protein
VDSAGVTTIACGPSLPGDRRRRVGARRVRRPPDRDGQLIVLFTDRETGAAEYLERDGMLGAGDASEIRIAPESLQGLDIRLTQAAPATDVGRRDEHRSSQIGDA